MNLVCKFEINDKKGIEVKIEKKKIRINYSDERYKKFAYFVAYLIERDEKALLIKENENRAYLLLADDEDEDIYYLYEIEGENYEEEDSSTYD